METDFSIKRKPHVIKFSTFLLKEYTMIVTSDHEIVLLTYINRPLRGGRCVCVGGGGLGAERAGKQCRTRSDLWSGYTLMANITCNIYKN